MSMSIKKGIYYTYFLLKCESIINCSAESLQKLAFTYGL